MVVKSYVVGWSLDFYTKEPDWINKTIIRAETVGEASTVYMKHYGTKTYASNPLFQLHVKEITNG